MRNLLSLSILALALPLHVLAGIGAEFELTRPAYGAAPDPQFEPSIASDGSGFFAVWLDQRMGPQTIVGTRVARDGTPLDPGGIVLPAKSAYVPRVVWNGASYLVVWYESDIGTAVARVAPDGTLLDTEARHPMSGTDYFYGAVAGSGSRTVIATRSVNGNASASILDANADLVVSVDLPPPPNDRSPRGLVAAWNGHSFVVADIVANFSCEGCTSEARITFISPDGAIESHVVTPSTLLDGGYSIAALPDRILIAAATGTKGYNAWIFDNQGTATTGTLGFAWNTPASSLVSIAIDSGSFVLTWPEWRSPVARILVTRMDRDGNAPVEPNVIATASARLADPAIARDSSGELVVAWGGAADPFEYERNVYARSVSTALMPTSDAVMLSISAPAQHGPAIGTNGTTWLVAWFESDGRGRRIIARRFASDGTPLDGEPIEVSARVFEFQWRYDTPSITSNGHDYFLVWRESFGGVYFRRLGPDGIWLDSEPRPIASDIWDISRQAAGWDGRDYFVVWSQRPLDGADGPVGVVGAKISAAGAASTPVPISFIDAGATEPVLARLGDAWLVVWTYTPPYPCQILCPAGDSDVVGARVTFDGTVIDPIPIQFSTPSALATDFARSPSIASSGSGVLIAWEATNEVRATYMNSSGYIYRGVGGNGVQMLATNGDWVDKSVAWDGRDFLVAVTDPTPASASGVMLYRMVGAVDPVTEGTEVSRGWVSLYDRRYSIALAARPGGKTLVVYPRIEFGPPCGNVSRLFARAIAARERMNPIRR